jgi:hypothetical protein
MLCPLCETDNPENAVDCSGCGKALRTASTVPDFAPPIPGLEQTLHAEVDAPLEEVPGLEPTMLGSPDLAVPDEHLEVEGSSVEEDPQAPQVWTPGQLELESGREMDLEPPTLPPQETAVCPWCGHASQGAVCDRCGQRKARYSAPTKEADGLPGPADLISCPNCFARVMPEARCAECGVPLLALA